MFNIMSHSADVSPLKDKEAEKITNAIHASQ